MRSAGPHRAATTIAATVILRIVVGAPGDVRAIQATFIS